MYVYVTSMYVLYFNFVKPVLYSNFSIWADIYGLL